MSYVATGIDPSTTNCGHYALVVLAAGGGLVLSDSGVCSARKGLALYDHCFVETPVRVHRAAAGKLLLRVAFYAGQYCSIHNGTAVAPEDWRYWLVGKRGPKDREVKAAIERRMVLPRCNVHVRDAIGVALYGLHLQGAL